MKRYRQLERFYKRGEFYGISEEIHLHVDREEGTFVANLFNLSDGVRTVSGSIPLQKMGLDPKRSYSASEQDGRIENGVFYVRREMGPWSACLIEVGSSGGSARRGKS